MNKYFIFLYFVLFFWSVIGLIYSLIRKREQAVILFAVLIPLLFIQVSSIIMSPDLIYLLYGV